MGMNASLWHQAGELPDRDDEPESEKHPKVGEEYELLVAMAPDGVALVYQAPEEFWTGTEDSDGSLHLREWMPRELEAGIYRVRAKFYFDHGRGEAGSHDPGGDSWGFEPTAYQPIVGGVPFGDWKPIKPV